ncbi:MAG: pyridoxamine 5'-phosphate oxidase family protein [Rhodospirillales bacterium]
MSEKHIIGSIEELEALYGAPSPNSLAKETGHITPHYRMMIEASPFVVLSTVGPEGTDCSPRGDPPGFVRVIDETTVAMPDRRGNNRIDSLRNIVRDPRVSLLFLVPGIGETLRINGRATLSTDPDLLESFAMDGKQPQSVIMVSVGSVYFQCQKALARSKLWDPETRIDRTSMPTAGDMIKGLTADGFDSAAYDAAYPERMKRTIY